MKISEFEVFEAIRKGKQKGGTMIGVHKALSPVLITELNDPFELLVVEVKIGEREIRIISGYGPQESWSPDQREPFFQALEEEIIKADLAGKSLIIEADFNSKLGVQFIPKDPHIQDKNGKLLADIILRQKLCVANGLRICKGTITRKRITTQRTEEIAISFVLVSEDLTDKIEAMNIDEKREHVLTRITKTKDGSEYKESDHNLIETRLKLSWSKEEAPKEEAIFNLKNKECQKFFKKETSKNCLANIFEEEKDLDKATEKFMKKLNKMLYKCFKKVKVKKDKVSNKEEGLYNRWKVLKDKEDVNSKAEKEDIEEELAEEYFDKIKLASKDIDCIQGGNVSSEIWKLKKQICPRSRDPPTAMMDNDGNLVTDTEAIKDMAVKAYQYRLRNRPIKEGLEDMKESKEKLAERVMEAARNNKTNPWDMIDLEIVLKNLKNNKSRDPNGLVNELFKEEAAGDDLKVATLRLMNRIKEEQKYPKCLESCNISSIWKLKGPQNQFSSYRGIFRVSIFRAILDRLIYNDEYDTIDGNLTDSNVGARKLRNIRDNIFVINAILNSQKNTHEEAIDVQIYDVEQCFDALWLQEVVTSLYEAGLRNDKLPLLFLENRNAQVAVKTPGGLSNRVNITNIIMQGSVWGSICCVVLMDKLGKLAYKHPELLYYYKGVVACPPLQMVDDILGVQKCSPQSVHLNTVINTFMEHQKLTLSKNKCHNIHIGSKANACRNLRVHESKMKESKSEKYLGDVLHNSGTVKLNVAKRLSKGWGRISEILAIVKEAPLGRRRIEAGLLLRKSLLLNGTLFNSEAWHGLKKGQIEAFEKIDEALIKGLLACHAKIPLPALYLETGQVPVRYILACRRILYLQTILHRSDEELIKRVYLAQRADTTDGDFCQLVDDDMRLLDLQLTDIQIGSISSFDLKKLVKVKARQASFKYLMDIKETKTKMDNISYMNSFLPQSYLLSMTREQSSLMVALRTRTLRGIRSDFGNMYVDKQCPLPGCQEPDSISHLLVCSVLQPAVPAGASVVQYGDVFSPFQEKQNTAVFSFSQLVNAREGLLEKNV